MQFLADFHIHSKYSRATAADLDLENLYKSAQTKGITVLGTGDFTHPAWWREINEKLVPAEEGLFKLQDDIAAAQDASLPAVCRRPVRFMLVTEISNIYKKAGRTRKNHNLVFMPDLESAALFNRRLDEIGNIRSDGRPILGLDARNLLEIVLETSPNGFLIPAHVWTPWFSLLGSKSGFDSVEDCFEDLSDHIFALETGLSSDPPMNWRVSALDRFTLVSNSDAHSPAKLGREANLFNTPLSYSAIHAALRNPSEEGFLGTLEFFPEEGKYHLDGHRKCEFHSYPEKTRKLDGICPVCGKPLTLGVLYRVEMLADQPSGRVPSGAKPFESLIPLEHLLAEVFNVGVKSKKVARAYRRLIDNFGCEFDVLRKIPCDRLERCGIPLLAESIERMRNNRVHFDAGFDGEFGKIKLFNSDERLTLQGQQCLFMQNKGSHPLYDDKTDAVITVQTSNTPAPATSDAGQVIMTHKDANSGETGNRIQLNTEQQAVVDHDKGPLMIMAGPGTGKTRTITCRMAHLISERKISPNKILAVTFTNKAADEMRRRLLNTVGPCVKIPLVSTFHGLCWRLLMEAQPDSQGGIADETVRRELVSDAVALAKADGVQVNMKSDVLLKDIIEAKQLLVGPEDNLGGISKNDIAPFKQVYTIYQRLLNQLNLYDFEDIIFQCVLALQNDGKWLKEIQNRFKYFFVDEFQDINYGQYVLVRLMAPPSAHICVIGDPDQAIYGFRGSDRRFFARFLRDYADTKIRHLSRNYRSVETILQSSFQVIRAQETETGQDFPKFKKKVIHSGILGHKTITILECASARAEAVAIGKTIERLVGGTGFHALDSGKIDQSEEPVCSFADFAILYRTTEQGRLIQTIITEAGIPCQNVSIEIWRKNPAVIKLLALLRVLADQASFSDLTELVTLVSPGISRTTVEDLKIWAYAKNLDVATSLATVMRLPIPTLTTTRQQRLAAMVRRISQLKLETSGTGVAETISRLAQTLFLNHAEHQEAIERLIEKARPFYRDRSLFLSSAVLLKDTDLYQNGAEQVALMTMHAAKGLEFPVVFIAGCEQGLIPFTPSSDQRCDLDEERRLFYVAMTRAEKRLFLSWAQRRTIFGKTAERRISQFCNDIESGLKQHCDETAFLKPMKQEQLSLF